MSNISPQYCDGLEIRIAELQAENKAWKKAAQAVLSNSDDVPTALVEFNKRLDALAALLEGEKDGD